MSSAYRGPVSKLLLAQNPWPFADRALDFPVEVMECDFAPEGQVFLLDLDAMDKLLDPTNLARCSEDERRRLPHRFGRIDIPRDLP